MTGMLPKRVLGRTGLSVSVLGLGTVKFGRNTDVKYPRPYALPDDGSAGRLLDEAAALGINLLDTAPAYGSAEARLGRLLRERRDHWVLCSKTGETHSDAGSSFDFSPEHTRFSVERSLKRLGTDRIDCLLVHSDGDDLAILRRHGTLEALAELKREGKILSYGMSTKTVAGGLVAVAECDVVMVTLNVDDVENLTVIAAARRRGCGVLVKKPLSSGRVSPASVEERLRWAATRLGVSAVVVGTLSHEHLTQNAQALASLTT